MTQLRIDQLLHQELDATKGLPRSANMVGHVLARRYAYAVQAHDGNCYAGVESLAVTVERTYGVTLDPRSVHRALMLLRVLGFWRIECCAGDGCVGGRGHAARYVPGWRRLAKGAHRLGVFLLARKSDIGVRASRFVTRTSTPKTKEERRSARLTGRRSGAAPPLPRAPAAAARARGDEGSGVERFADAAARLLPQLFPAS